MPERSEHWALNHLIETCRDGERGFRHAASQVRDPELKALFAELSAQRGRFATELLPHAQRLGGDAPSEGTRAGALHRNWMELKGKLTGHADRAIITEAERGDRLTLQAYKDAIAGLIPPEAREVIERQYAALQDSNMRITAIERSAQTGV